MPVTSEVAKETARANKLKYGSDFYKRIGKIGGSAQKSKPSGFAAMSKAKVSAAGPKGGTISRRGKAYL